MNFTLDIYFKKESSQISVFSSVFSYNRTKNWLHLWVEDIYIGDHPFTYTVEEALEDFCERRGQMFKKINFIGGTDAFKWGTYLWRRP